MNGPYINSATKDYVLVNGNIENQDILLSMFYLRLECPYGEYIFDRQRGCRIQNQIGNRTVTNKKTLENFIYAALSDMISLGFLTSLSVICTFFDFRQAIFNITAVASNQQIIKFTWTLPL